MSIVKNIKNLFSVRIALLCCLVGTAGLAQAESKLYVEDFSIQPGEEQTIALYLDTDVELRSIEGTLMMPEGLEVQDVSSAKITVDKNRISNAYSIYNPENGYLSINGFGTTISIGNGTLAFIKVKATEALANGSKVTLSDFVGKDKNKNKFSLSTADATVSIGATPVVSFNPAALSLLPGATSTVEVQLENSMDLTGGQATVEVSEGLEFAGLTKSARLNGNIIPNLETMTVMYFDKDNPIASGSGTVMTVTIKAAEGFTGGYIKLKNMVVTTSNVKSYYPKDVELEVTLNDGTVVVDGEAINIDETKGTPKAGVIADGLVAKSFSYKRTLPAGQACTVCLPYAPSATGVKFYELTGAEGETLSFTEVASPAAATPYLAVAKAATDITPANIANVTLTQAVTGSSTAGGYTLKGTLTGLTNAEGVAAGAYILQAGGVWKKVTTANTDAYIPPFRGYIVGGSAARLGTALGETTAIGNLRTVDLDGAEHWYDLNGRSIAAPAQRGIYIVNGKKILK